MSEVTPNFFLLGANKAGTTSLSYYLSQHPDVFMSEPKEPPFFGAEYDRGMAYYQRTYFRRHAGEKIAGDAATQHLHLPFVATRIAASIHDPLFAVICRNPVERLLSAYWHCVSRGFEFRPIEEVIDTNFRLLTEGQAFETEREAALYARVLKTRGDAGLVQDFCLYLDPGYYAQNIERYRAIFGKNRIKIVFFEDLSANAEAVTNDVLGFLGLTPVSGLDTRKLNQARSRTATRLLDHIATMPGIERIPLHLRTTAKQLIGQILTNRWNIKPPLSPALRRQLVEHYSPHNRRLAALTGRSLDHWS